MTSMRFPEAVRIVEVGPRDGLQNEAKPIGTQRKLDFIRKLVDAGVQHIEATSFVRPERVPQLADADELVSHLPEPDHVTYSALVPNERGLDRALAAGVRRIAVFTAASESFNQKNVGMSIEDSLAAFSSIVERAAREGCTMRGYLSTCFVCPYEGDVPRERVRELTLRLLDLGVDEVALSDTIGAASPRDIFETAGHVLQRATTERIALHLHDTYGTALANVVAGLELGIRTFDASTGGLGGCPFAPGAAGNLATEDLVYMLQRMGVETGISVEGLVQAADVLADYVEHPLTSRQYRRLRSACTVSTAR